MWQRKQTFFLALAFLCLAAMMFFPIWVDDREGYSRALFPLCAADKSGGEAAYLYFPFALNATAAIAAATLSLISIRRYDNRRLQLKIGTLNSLLMGTSVVLGAYFAGDMIKKYQTLGAYGVSLYLPMAATVCNLLANFFIRRDERLVRDADRIR